MEIIIYDNNLNRRGIVENQTSVIWTRKYFETGNFEIHAPLTKRNLSLFAKGNIVYKKGSIEAGIIEDIVNDEGNSISEITVKGRFLESYMDRRLIKNTLTFSGSVENAMRFLLQNVTSIPKFELSDENNNFPESVSFQATMKNLLSIIVKLSKSSNIGFRCVPDFVNKKIKFQVYKGIDRTLSQHINNRVVFSEAYNNLNKSIYRWNNQLHKTLAIVGGEGEGASRRYITVGGGEGLELREIFVDARDISSDKLTDEEYINALKQRGYEALAKNVESESFEYETDVDINFKYKVDYDLGDIVTVHKKSWGIKLNQRITEITEVYEKGGMTVIPTLGNALPTSVDWSDK